MTQNDTVAYLVKRTSSGCYLQRRPYDGAWIWQATIWQHATPLAYADAIRLARELGEPFEILTDRLHRQPEMVEHHAQNV